MHFLNIFADVGPSICESDSYCGYTNAYVNPGESNVGEYGANPNAECCGDDAGEYLKSGNGYTLCCDNPNDYIDINGNCKPRGKPKLVSRLDVPPLGSPEQEDIFSQLINFFKDLF